MLYFLLFPLIFFTVPTFHWLDSAELSCAACSLGVGHPPGQVTHAMLGFVFSLLPIGDCGFRITLLSLGCTFAAAIFLSLFLKQKLKSKLSVLGIILFYALILCPIVILQAKRPEVYGLSFLLFAATLWFSEHEGDVRFQMIATFLWGLGMINHPVIGLASTPFIIRRGPIVLYVAWLPINLLLLYLSLRSNAGTPWDFGHPASFFELQWFLRGKLYKAYDQVTLIQIYQNLQNIFVLFLENVKPIICMLVLVGMSWVYHFNREWALRLIASLFLSIFPLMTMSNFSSSNPDVGGYLLPSFALLLIWAVLGCGALHRYIKDRKIIFYLLAGYLGAQVVFVTQNQAKVPDWSALTQLRLLSSEPSAHANVQVASFHTFSFLRYAQIIEGARPDVDLNYRGLRPLPHPGLPFKGPRDQFWELAIDRNPNGLYTLREEDRLRAPHFKQSGWFQRIDFSGEPIDLKTYSQRIDQVIQNSPTREDVFLEPLLLNQLNQISLSTLTHDMVRSKELVKTVNHTFPHFDEFSKLVGEEKGLP